MAAGRGRCACSLTDVLAWRVSVQIAAVCKVCTCCCSQMELQATSLVFNVNIVLHQAGQVLGGLLLARSRMQCARPVSENMSPALILTSFLLLQPAWSIMNFPKARTSLTTR